MDTPNLVHLYNRQKFERGESVMPAIATQFYAEVPFQGHHREYTVAELVWMLDEIGHTDMSVELFNYSVYGNAQLRGRDVDNYWAMVADPTLREMIMTTSRKPPAGTRERRPPVSGGLPPLACVAGARQARRPARLRTLRALRNDHSLRFAVRGDQRRKNPCLVQRATCHRHGTRRDLSRVRGRQLVRHSLHERRFEMIHNDVLAIVGNLPTSSLRAKIS
jgi:hypothetical protein